MYWLLLIIAGLFEVAFTFCLGKGKETQGTTMYLWYGGFLLCTFVSMSLLMKVSQHLPLGTAYAVWTGIGAVGTALVGIFRLQGTRFLLAPLLSLYPHRLCSGTQSSI